jgi:hypothetical protein
MSDLREKFCSLITQNDTETKIKVLAKEMSLTKKICFTASKACKAHMPSWQQTDLAIDQNKVNPLEL